MLSAEFSLRLEPFLEEMRLGLDHFEVLQRHVVEAFGLIVGVDLLQLAVEAVGKLLHVVWIL